MRFGLLPCLCLAKAILGAAFVAPRAASLAPHLPAAGFGTALRSRGAVVRHSGERVKEPAPILGNCYAVVGVLSLVAWAATAVVALSHHPRLRLPRRHNLLTIAQALAQIPVGASVFLSLSRSASKEGWWAMNRMTYRRLNLGLVFASLWLAAAAWYAPAFTTGYRMYSPSFALLIATTHLSAGLFCAFVWLRSVDPSPRPLRGHYIPRLARGLVGSIWALVPQTSETSSISANGSASHLDDPESTAGGDGRNEYALACVLFLLFAALPIFVGFPLATVPSILGKRLSRAASAWTFLAAISAYVLKDATQRGRIHSGTTFRYLRYGLIGSSGLHLLLVALKLGGIDGGHAGLLKFYPGALSCPKTALASLVMHGLVVFAALTPPPKIPKASKAVSAASAVPAPAPAQLASPSPPPPAPAAPAVSAPAPAAGTPQMDQKVVFKGNSGIVRYLGPTQFAPGDWVGVELDSDSGTHDGSVFGVRYFSCPPGRGIFARSSQLS